MTDNTVNLHPTTTSQQLTDLDEGVEYKVWARARYHDGADGPWSGSWAEATRQVAARPSSGVRSDDEPPVTLEPPQLTVIEPDDPDDPPVALQQSADGSVSEPDDPDDPPVTLAPLQLTVIEPDTDDPDDPDVPLVALRQSADGSVSEPADGDLPADTTTTTGVLIVDGNGLNAILAYYNREESVDGQWYVFIIDENDLVVGHPDARRLGLDLNGWVGTDANGYNFGPEMLSATEDGRWVSYVYRNPESGGIGDDHTGALEYKYVWVVRRDGLLFASGWHISADQYTQFVVDEAIARYHADGLDATLAHYNNPDSVDAQWYVFVATPEGEILGHYNADDLGAHLEEMLDDGSFTAIEEGVWVTGEDVNPSREKLRTSISGWPIMTGWCSAPAGTTTNRVAREGLPTPGQLIPTLWAGSVSGRRSGSALWERPCVDAHPPSQRTHRGAQPPSLDCCLSWQT